MWELQWQTGDSRGKKWRGCHGNQKDHPPPHEPESCTQYLSTPTHRHQHHHHHQHQRREPFLRQRDCLICLWTRFYSYTITRSTYTAPASEMELSEDVPTHYRHQLFISALKPRKPIVLVRQAWPPLSLSLTFSSSLFESEEEGG